jgi:single-strand DNA-binding protein
MSSLNKVTLIGHLGSDPEKKYTGSGIPVVSLSLATTERWKDDNGQAQEQTEWHRLVFWRGLADLVDEYLHKGSRVYVEGKLQTRQWEDQEGRNRYSTEVVCRELKFLDSKNSSEKQFSSDPNLNHIPTPSNGDAQMAEGDIPF